MTQIQRHHTLQRQSKYQGELQMPKPILQQQTQKLQLQIQLQLQLLP